MNILSTVIFSVVAELSSPDYVIYPVDDILYSVPQFNDSPNFRLGLPLRSYENNSTGYTETKNDRIGTIRMIIQEDFRSRGIDVKVFFFNGNFIVGPTN